MRIFRVVNKPRSDLLSSDARAEELAWRLRMRNGDKHVFRLLRSRINCENVEAQLAQAAKRYPDQHTNTQTHMCTNTYAIYRETCAGV